jgi:subtilisin family serine protease
VLIDMVKPGNRVLIAAVIGVALLQTGAGVVAEPVRTGYIVEAGAAADAARAVRGVGGLVTHELPIVNGVSALLSGSQAARLRNHKEISLFAEARSRPSRPAALPDTTPDIYQRAMIGVNELASQGINGSGVTVAVLDSGILQKKTLSYLTADSNGNNRMVAQFDAINNVLVDASHPCQNYPCVNDDYGHGSHVTGLIASSNTSDAVPQRAAAGHRADGTPDQRQGVRRRWHRDLLQRAQRVELDLRQSHDLRHDPGREHVLRCDADSRFTGTIPSTRR